MVAACTDTQLYMWAFVEMKQLHPSVFSSNPTGDFDKQQFYLAEHNVSISIVAGVKSFDATHTQGHILTIGIVC